MKKALSLAMAAAMTMGLAACGSTASSTAAADSTPASSAAESEAAPAADGKVYNIGICQLVQHEALDAATQGFKDALTEKLGADNVKTSRTLPAILPTAPPSSAALFPLVST